MVEQTNNKELSDRIAEQKDILDILLIILNNYNKDENFATLAQHIQNLKNQYEKVRITTEMGEAKRIEKDGVLIIVQNEISHIEASPETLKAIMQEIKNIRQFIIE